MDNIFENAYFGKAYKTRDDRKAIYGGNNGESLLHSLMFQKKDGDDYLGLYNTDGTYCIRRCTHLDIVSEWLEPIVCKCQWEDYYDYHLMLPNGEGHVRVSFFEDEILISDLYVSEEHRHKGYATILLDKVDELLNNKTATIYALEEWQQKWYERRGYAIGKEEPLDEEELNELAHNQCYIQHEGDFKLDTYSLMIGFKAGYHKAMEYLQRQFHRT